MGMVTLPRGLDPAKVPLVVFPHGGPWSRDHGAYKSPRLLFWQTADTRCLSQPSGHQQVMGFKYVMAAERDFGKGRVHQDIMDGIGVCSFTRYR